MNCALILKHGWIRDPEFKWWIFWWHGTPQCGDSRYQPVEQLHGEAALQAEGWLR